MRKIGLMHGLDRLNFLMHKLRNHKKNKRFIKDHPQVKLPPAYTLYEAYRIDYHSYYNDGRNTAEWIARELSDLIPSHNKRVLDWGCGPARVVRHLPELLPGAEIFGSDYNPETIEWCRQHIPDVHFRVNSLQPPLAFKENFFDAVYALSVFTHLSEDNHHKWINELHRIVRPGGFVLLTTQGEVFVDKLTEQEKSFFVEGSLVIRDQVKEGHRSFSAFQPESFMRSFFSDGWKVVKFVKGTVQHWGPEQDTWVVEKP